MKRALNNLKVRSDEVVRTLRWALSRNDRWQAKVGTLLYHAMEIHHNTHSRAKYRYGVEIEMDFKFRGEEHLQPAAIVARNLLRTTLGESTYSVQRDESLACGFEVVTAPLSLHVLKKLQVLFDDTDLMNCLDEHTKTAGLHITVDPFATREQEQRFFDYFNTPARVVDLKGVFGRPLNEYCKIRNLKRGMRTIKDHNYIVHIRPNRALEVRAFKSPTRWIEFWQRLMLVHKVNKLVRETTLTPAQIHEKIKRGIK